jgi:acetyl-CoA carboxylase biotin carboxyl carrier protein
MLVWAHKQHWLPSKGKEALMNIKEVKDLIQEVLQSDISEFELEQTGTRIRLKRGFSNEAGAAASAPAPAAVVSFAPPEPIAAETAAPPDDSAASAAADAAGDSADDEDSGLHIIASPIVGTFYRAPSPGADSFVKIGDHVEEGTILCIVEAMKLMNEIPSDIEGEVARVYVENGHPVEFGQKLFGIRPQNQG